jgi:uncharacterized membrane protein YbhN (UPF0104 family)
MKSNKLFDILKILFVVGLVTWAAFKFDAKTATAILGAANLKWGAFSLALMLGSFVLFSMRWQKISKGIWAETRISVWYFLYLNLAATFYVLFIPTSIAGETVRVLKLKAKASTDYSKAILCVALDRVTGLTTWIIIFAIMPSPLYFNKLWLLPLIPIAGFVVFKSRFKVWEHEIFDFSRHHPKDIAAAVGFSLLGQMMGAVSTYAAFRCLLIDIPFFSALGLAATGALASIIPLSWLGIGMRETSFIALLPRFGVNTTTTLLAAGLLVILNYIMGLMGGILELSHTGWKLSKLKIPEAEEKAVK